MGQDLGSPVEEKSVENVSRENWMEEIFEGSPVKLRDIMVLGTHNSFANGSSLPKQNSKLKFSKETGISETCSKLWVGKTIAKNLCRDWSPCQSCSISQQLMDGVRYLDFRVKRTTGVNFEVCHSIGFGALMPLLDEVKAFITTNPKELVFLHIQKIYNCNTAQERSLASKLISKFKDKIVSPKKFSFDSRLKDIWNLKKGIIIFFEKPSAVQTFPEYLWNNNAVSNRWFNKSKIGELRSAIAGELKNGQTHGNRLWVIQAILTPRTEDVVSSFGSTFTRRPNSLSALTNNLCCDLPTWFKEFAVNRSNADRNPNVIMVDFYNWGSLFPLLTRVNIAMSRRFKKIHDGSNVQGNEEKKRRLSVGLETSGSIKRHHN